MADIELVIKIPEEIYTHLLARYKYQNTYDIGLSELDKVGVSIKNGTPLPKGHGRLTNHDWIDFLCEQFDISRTSAKEMLHAMMSVKKVDNFKKQFSQGKKGFSQGFSQSRK